MLKRLLTGFVGLWSVELTSGTGINCPECGKEVMIKTSGFLGSIFTHLSAKLDINSVKNSGGTYTVKSNCGHTFKLKNGVASRAVAFFHEHAI